MMTLRPLETIRIVSVPVRALVNVTTGMTLRWTVVAEVSLIVRRNAPPQYARTVPHVGQVVATSAIRRATTPVRTSFALTRVERTKVER